MRSRKAVTSGIIEPPKPRLRTGSPAKSSFSDVHIRMLELPVEMMPPFGGGAAMSSASKAWMSASKRDGSGPSGAAEAGLGAGAWAGARSNATRSNARLICMGAPLSRHGGHDATETRRARRSIQHGDAEKHGGSLFRRRRGDAENTEADFFRRRHGSCGERGALLSNEPAEAVDETAGVEIQQPAHVQAACLQITEHLRLEDPVEALDGLHFDHGGLGDDEVQVVVAHDSA